MSDKQRNEPRLSVQISTENFKGFTNKKCEFFPCHKVEEFRNPEEFNCMFCTCALYWLECPGNYEVIEDADGVKRKDCSNCKLPHDGYDRSWKLMNISRFQRKPVPWSGK